MNEKLEKKEEENFKMWDYNGKKTEAYNLDLGSSPNFAVSYFL